MYFFEEHGVLLRDSDCWEEPHYGYKPYGKGDCIWRTMILAMVRKDSSYVDLAAELLKERKRWPDDLNHENDAKNRIEKWRNDHLYRWQHGMTRDPFTNFYTACELLHQHQHFSDVKVPLYIQRPSFYHWKKHLETRKECHKRMYERWSVWELNTMGHKLPMYSKHLNAFRAVAVDSGAVKKALLPHIPKWNYFLRLLCGDHLGVDELLAVEEYRSKRGWQWAAEEWIDKDYLPDGENCYLDKEALNWSLNLQING